MEIYMRKWFSLNWNSLFKSAVLLVFPTIFLFFALPFNRTHFGNDPEYAYLLNGINIGTLNSVGHTDNPGTTAQIYSAIVLRCAFLAQADKSEGFEKFILRNADQHIELERKVLIVLNGIVMLVIGIVSFVIMRNIWFSLVLQITPFTSANLTEHIFTKVSPEPVLLIVSAALVLLIISYYFNIKREEKKYALLFALVSGFGLATKATFLPLIIIPLLLMSNPMLRKRFLLYLGLFFIVFTLPAVPQYPHMAKWFLILLTHTGAYGGGEVGIFNVTEYVGNLVKISFVNPMLSVTSIFSVLIIFSKLRKSTFTSEFKSNSGFRMVTVLAVAQLTGIFMVAKHYHANHYLIPELCMLALNWIFIFIYLQEILPIKYRKAFLYSPILLMMVVMINISMNRNYLQAANQGYILSNKDYRRMTQLIENEYKGYVCAYYYPASVNPYSALRWGNVYSRFLHTQVIKEILPDGYFYDIRTFQFSLWDTPVSTSIMRAISNDKLLIIGGPVTEIERLRIEHKSGIKLIEVFRGHAQVVYRVSFDSLRYSNEMVKRGVISFNKPSMAYIVNDVNGILYKSWYTRLQDISNYYTADFGSSREPNIPVV